METRNSATRNRTCNAAEDAPEEVLEEVEKSNRDASGGGASRSVANVILVERERRIPKFYGDDPTAAVEFGEEIRRAWAPLPLNSQAQRLNVLLGSVGPTVRAELRCQPREVQDDPEKALAVILDVFGERRTPAQLLQSLLTHQQLLPETVRAFSHRCQATYLALVQRQEALGEVPYQERLLRDHFVSNLRDQTLVRFLRDSLHQTPDQTFGAIRETAIRWADDGRTEVTVAPVAVNTAASPSSAPPPTAGPNLEAVLASLVQKMDQLINVQRQPRRDRRDKDGQRLCFRCGKPGHLKRDCPEGKN